MRRREFVTFVGGAVLCPLAAHAQQPERMRLIGVLMGYSENDSEGQAQIAAFRDGLQKLGWMEGRNIRIDTRWVTTTDAELMQQFAKELVALQPDLIFVEQHAHDGRAAATNARHPYRFRDSRRSHRQRLRSKLPAAGRQCHRFHHCRGLAGREVAGAAQGDCAARQIG